MTDYPWDPLTVDQLAAVLAPMGVRWWVAGGWAIDVFLGRQTRTHADIDAAVLRSEHPRLAGLQPEWELHIADDGSLTPWPGDAPLPPAQHQFWVRRPGATVWAFELLLEESAGETWIYRRDPRITLPLARIGAITDENVPYIRPEIALLYKSNRAELERNAADFMATAPVLDEDARSWLRETIELTSPGHAWVSRL